MDQDDRYPGRAKLLGLPSRETLEDDLGQAISIVLLQVQVLRSCLDDESLDPGTATQLTSTVGRNILAAWHNQKHALSHIAEWHEAEGAYSAAEPLYALGAAAHRIAFREGLNAPFAFDPNLSEPMHLAVALNNFALCHKRQGTHTRALPLYREAVRLFPRGRAPAFMRDNLAKCEAIVNKPTRASVGAHYVGGAQQQQSSAGDLRETGAEARERIRELGNDAFRRGRNDEAIHMYTLALAADDGASADERAPPSERAKILCNRADAALAHSDFDAAAADASAATALDASNAKAWYRLGVALQHTARKQEALDALRRALGCAPDWSTKVRELITKLEEQGASDSSGAKNKVPYGGLDISTVRFADTALGRLDRLVAGGVDTLGANGWLRGLYTSAAKWHTALRDCQNFRSLGVSMATDMVARLPAGTAHELSDSGAGQRRLDANAADVLRRLSDAICAVDESSITCPLYCWLDGRQYNVHQTSHAINGLGEVLRRKDTIFDLGLSDQQGHNPRATPVMSDKQLVRTLKALDLADDATCEKLELTLRHGVLVHHFTMRISYNSDGGLTGELVLVMLEWLKRLMMIRNLVVYRAHKAVGGAEPPLVRAREQGMPALHAWKEVFLSPDPSTMPDVEAVAIDWVRQRSPAGKLLARMLNEPFPFEAYLQLARTSLHMPDAAFGGNSSAVEMLDSHETLFRFASWAARVFKFDPRFPCHCGSVIYDSARNGKLLEAFEGTPPRFAAAHRIYMHAAELAEESSLEGVRQGCTVHLPALYLWEAANALCASNGDDYLGVELSSVRELAARAKAVMESTRGLFDCDAPGQAQVAVELVLEATRTRLGTQKLSSAEHRRITKKVLEGTPEESIAAMEEWKARAMPRERVAKAPGLPDVGPMWIPGMAPPAMQAS